MKRSQALAVLVLALLMAAAIPVEQAGAQSAYSEKLNVYVAGNNALWYFTFTGINGSSKLGALESSPGLSWYNVTTVKTSSWGPDFQVFGPQGYNVFPVASPPAEGALLTVGSDSYADASAAAASLGSYLLTQFVSSANSSGVYSFYAPLAFNIIVPKTLLTLVPTGPGGFAKAITAAGLESTLSPFVILEGTKASSGFNHALIVGSISGPALDGLSRPNILHLYGTSLTFLQAAAHGTSSIIQVQVLDGAMKSKDTATVTNDIVHFSSSYTLTLAPSKKLTVVNATVLQQSPALLAYRTISRGVLRTGQKLQVTVTLTNLSPSQSLTNITYSDNWWNSTGDFALTTSKNSTTFPSTISPGAAGTVTPVYILKYVGNTTGKLTIPASVITYSFTLGSSTFKGRTVLNPITLSLGVDEPVVYSYVVPTGGFYRSVGANQSLRVSAVNVGTQAASSVVVAGKSISGLAINTTSVVTVTQYAHGITQNNVTQSYSATYQDVAGNHLQSDSNILQDVLSHNSMVIGLPTLVVSQSLVLFKVHGVNLTLVFTVTNLGTTNVTSFSSQGSLPRGLPCGVIKGNGTTCSAGVVSINYALLTSGKIHRSYMTFNVTTPTNFMLGPIVFHGTTSRISVQGTSNPLGIPTGFAVNKQFVPSQLFGGMASSVTLFAANGGPFTVYNVTFSSGADTFDTLSATATNSKTSTIVAGSTSTLNYTVKALPKQGIFNSSGSSASFYFGGSLFTQSYRGPRVAIYQPLSATITTSPAATTEGKQFILDISVLNPSGVAVSKVVFTIPVPGGLTLTQLQGMTLTGRNITIFAASLAPHSSLNASAAVEASSGITVPFNEATLTFSYGGVTVSGSLPTGGIAIGENVTTRYVLPIALGLLVLLAAAYYIRKISKSSAPASRT